MSTATFKQDRAQILNELERYYQDKLDGVRAKRAGHGTQPERNKSLQKEVFKFASTRKRLFFPGEELMKDFGHWKSEAQPLQHREESGHPHREENGGQ